MAGDGGKADAGLSAGPGADRYVAMVARAKALIPELRDRASKTEELRRLPPVLYLACAMLFVGVLIDKGIGTIIPGFVPEPWGRIPTYSPTWVELTVSAGLWALGAFVFTVLAKAAIPIELGQSRLRPQSGSPRA